MPSQRIEKLNELIRHEVSRLLMEDLQNEDGLGVITILRVDTTPDLAQAIVYVSSLNPEVNKSKILRVIKKHIYSIQKNLDEALYLRKVPKLIFRFDDSADYVQRIEELLNEINKSSQQ